MTNNGRLIARSAFLVPAKRRYREVTLQNGQTVRIRNLTEREKSAFEAAVLTSKGEPSRARLADLNCRLMIITLVDADGNLLLKPEDLPALQELDGAVTNALVDCIRDWCGFGKTDFEGLIKNSETIAAGDSPSG